MASRKYRLARTAAAVAGSVGLLGGGIVLGAESTAAAATPAAVTAGKYAGCSTGTTGNPLLGLLGGLGTLVCIITRTL